MGRRSSELILGCTLPVNWSEQAAMVGKLFEILPEDGLPGLYRHIAQIADLEGASEAPSSPSREAAQQLRFAIEDLLSVGAPDDDAKRQWRASRQLAVVNWMHRLAADDTRLGQSRRASMEKFGKERGHDQTAARQRAWAAWQATAEQLVREDPRMASAGMTDIARKVQKRAGISESVQTIRKRLKKTW